MTNKEKLNEFIRDQIHEVKNSSDAQGVIRKIESLDEEVQEVEWLADAEIQRIKEWKNKELEKLQREIDHNKAILQGFMEKQRETTGKKSLSLPNGRIRFKKQQPLFKFDNEKTIEYLRSNYPDLIKTKEDFNRNEAKKLVKENGEVWDGVEVEHREDKFEVVINDD